MTRAEFLAFLARAAEDPNIRLTVEEAGALLADFDAGRLTEANLPLPLEEAIQGLTREDLERVAAVLLAAGLLLGNRERGRDRLRSRFIAEARAFAEAVAADDLSVADWQGLTRDTTRDHIAGQAVLGAGSAAKAVELLPALDRSARQQTAYLSRFADAVAAAGVLGMAWSVGQIASRAVTYAGAAYAWFSRAKESDGDRAGWIVDYVAQDDDRTCVACAQAAAEGPYQVGEGPQPGDVCFGGGACRCQRRERYDMDAWRTLTGR